MDFDWHAVDVELGTDGDLDGAAVWRRIMHAVADCGIGSSSWFVDGSSPLFVKGFLCKQSAYKPSILFGGSLAGSRANMIAKSCGMPATSA
jgi:hypothetical protein